MVYAATMNAMSEYRPGVVKLILPSAHATGADEMTSAVVVLYHVRVKEAHEDTVSIAPCGVPG